MVTVKLFGYLKEISKDAKNGKITIKLDKEVTLKAFLETIKDKLGDKVIKAVFEDFDSFKLREDMILLLNGKMETNPNKKISNSDVISLMPFVSGGSVLNQRF